MEPQKTPLSAKIVSILSFLSALISGFWSWWFFAWSGFTPGINVKELYFVAIYFIIAALLVVLGIFTWKGRNWAKYLACLFILITLVISYLYINA